MQKAAVVALAGAGWLSAASAGAASKIYLNFSDGTEELRQGAADDAGHNWSSLCGARPLSSWDGANDCGDRESCRARVADLVQEHWNDFDIELSIKRPIGHYTMVMIGPPSGTCVFGVRGISNVDCGNQLDKDVALAFECNGAASVCASVISHEAGHAFGLVHSTDPSDIMYGGMVEGVEPQFLDRWSPVADPGCGATTQNSYRKLLETLGAWPAGRSRRKDWAPSDGGCQVAESSSTFSARALLLVWLLVTPRLRSAGRIRPGGARQPR
jgi:hypothetical protein